MNDITVSKSSQVKISYATTPPSEDSQTNRGNSKDNKAIQLAAQKSLKELDQGKQQIFDHQFVLSTKNGRFDVAKAFFAKGANVNAKDDDGRTSLYYAARSGDCTFANFLLGNQAKVDTKDHSNGTPLLEAVSSGSLEAIKLLLDHGADIEAEDAVFETALHRAAELKKDSVEIVRELFKRGAKVRQTNGKASPLHYAAEEGNIPLVELFLSLGYDIDLKNEFGNTCLHLAVNKQNEKLVDLLLERGAKVNVKMDRGLTPLHVAAQCGNGPIISKLLDKKPRLYEKDCEGRTPLHYAAEIKGEAFNQLFSKMSKSDLPDGQGYTPLMLAASKGLLENVELLLSKKADVNHQANDNSTPLNCAIVSKNLDCLKTLWSAGARSKTPVQLAAMHGVEPLKFLFEQGLPLECEANVPDPLHAACIANQLECVEFLISQGVALDKPDKKHYNLTPLKIAIKGGFYQIAERLIEAGADSVSTVSEHSALFWVLTSPSKINNKLAHLMIENSIRRGRLIDMDSFCVCLKSGRIDFARMMMSHVDINRASKQVSPLHFACECLVKEKISDLLDLLFENKELDIEIKNKEGQTALAASAKNGTGIAVKKLIEAGANVNTKNSKEETPLHIALKEGHYEIAEMLILAKADVNAMTVKREKPLDIALCGKSAEASKIVELLKVNKATQSEEVSQADSDPDPEKENRLLDIYKRNKEEEKKARLTRHEENKLKKTRAPAENVQKKSKNSKRNEKRRERLAKKEKLPALSSKGFEKENVNPADIFLEKTPPDLRKIVDQKELICVREETRLLADGTPYKKQDVETEKPVVVKKLISLTQNQSYSLKNAKIFLQKLEVLYKTSFGEKIDRLLNRSAKYCLLKICEAIHPSNSSLILESLTDDQKLFRRIRNGLKRNRLTSKNDRISHLCRAFIESELKEGINQSLDGIQPVKMNPYYELTLSANIVEKKRKTSVEDFFLKIDKEFKVLQKIASKLEASEAPFEMALKMTLSNISYYFKELAKLYKHDLISKDSATYSALKALIIAGTKIGHFKEDFKEDISPFELSILESSLKQSREEFNLLKQAYIESRATQDMPSEILK